MFSNVENLDIEARRIATSTNAAEAEAPPSQYTRWLLRDEGGHRGTQVALKSLWTSNDRSYTHFLPLLSLSHREGPCALSLLYYQDLALSLGLNLSKEFNVHAGVTLGSTAHLKTKPSFLPSLLKPLEKELGEVRATDAQISMEYRKKDNYSLQIIAQTISGQRTSFATTLAFTKQFSRRFTFGTSIGLFRTLGVPNRAVNPYVLVAAKQNFDSLIMTESIDTNSNCKFTALYLNSAARKRAEKESKSPEELELAKEKEDSTEGKDWGIMPTLQMNLGLLSKSIGILGGLRLENDNNQANFTLLTAKSPETNTSFMAGLSYARKVNDLAIGLVYETGGETPLKNLWANRGSRYGLRVSFNV